MFWASDIFCPPTRVSYGLALSGFTWLTLRLLDCIPSYLQPHFDGENVFRFFADFTTLSMHHGLTAHMRLKDIELYIYIYLIFLLKYTIKKNILKVELCQYELCPYMRLKDNEHIEGSWFWSFAVLWIMLLKIFCNKPHFAPKDFVH